jgi:hypothetical protein
MNNRESLEAEVRRITSPQAHPLIVERPDGTELKLHIRAISFDDLQSATDVIAQVTQGGIYAMLKVDEMRAKLAVPDEFEKADIFTEEVAKRLKDKLLSFLPWLIKVGTDIKFSDIEGLDYLVTLEILVEIVKFNFGKRLMDFFSRASTVIDPLMRREKLAKLADGISPRPSSLAEEMASKASGVGPSES